MTINAKREVPLKEEKIQIRTTSEAHKNFMGGNSFDISNPILRLKCMAASCFFGEPQYYKEEGKTKKPRNTMAARRASSVATLTEQQVKYLRDTLNGVDMREWRGLSPSNAMEKAIDEALAYDAEATLQLAVYLRSEDNIRVTPQVIVVRAANTPAVKGTGLIRKYAAEVMQRADEPATQMAYQLATYGADKPIPNGLKRAWRDYLSRMNDYHLAKYRMEGRMVKTVDVVNVVHPTGSSVDKLVKGELKLGGEDTETWESMRSAGKPWDETVPVMGHMALLRNIRNLVQAGVKPELWTEKLVKTAPTGRQLPFRYYSAFREVEQVTKDARVLDAIETAMEMSLENLPILPGRSLVLTDNSGSARGVTTSTMGSMQMSTIGNLMGILTAKISANGGDLGVFGDRLEMLSIRKKSSTLDLLKQAENLATKVGGSTEHGIWLAMDQITNKNEKYDNIFVYSDMQAGHGGLYGTGGYDNFLWGDRNQNGFMMSRGTPYIDVPKLVRRYRDRVNPNVNVFLVQIAGYEDTLIPEWYDRTYILGGWSDGILKYAASMVQMRQQ